LVDRGRVDLALVTRDAGGGPSCGHRSAIPRACRDVGMPRHPRSRGGWRGKGERRDVGKIRRSSRDIWRVGDRGAHARRPGGTRASRVSPPGPLATRRSILDLCARRRFPSLRVCTTRASRRSSHDQPRCLHASPQPQTRHGTGPFPPARRAGIPLASSRRTSRDTRSMPSPASSCTLEP